MHFWINKGNQQGLYWPRAACRLVRPPPEAVANYLARHQIIRPRGLYPKPMVTPVRRFQSLESVANNGLRHSRSSPGHRANRHNNAHVMYYNTTNNRISRLERERSIDVDNDQPSPQTLEGNELESYIRKFKIALLAFAIFSVCVMFGANYLSTGQLWRLGVETLVIISVALVVLLLGGIIILYLDERQNANPAIVSPHLLESSSDQMPLEEIHHRQEQDRPTQLYLPDADIQEMSPPPYHIAIRLANSTVIEDIQVYDDQSPPPPYEKAVT